MVTKLKYKFNFSLRLYSLIATSLILAPLTFAQWEWQNPLPQGNEFEQVLFIDDYYGWMLTLGGTLMRTTDGGSNRNEQIIGKLWSHKIHFIGKFNGWCVGSGAPPYIMQTEDGGITWSDLPIPDERDDGGYYNLWDVFFIDKLNGYFVDNRGAIFHTSDGGQSWIKQFQNFPSRGLKSIYFLDSLKGFAVGDDALKRTDNGGEMWYADSSVILPFSADPRKIQFIGDFYGWIMSSKSIFRTIDAGETWIEYVIDTNWTQNNRAVDIMFIDTANGWICSGPGLYQSADSGKTWEYFNSNEFIYNIHFFNFNDGWGTSGEKHYSTSDGGLTWITDWTSITEQTFYALDFIDENRGWAVGRGGEIRHTTDGGKTWQKQFGGTTQSLWNVEFWDRDIGWIVGWGGVVLRTTAGGNSWQMRTVSSIEYLEATSFVSPQEGWAVGRTAGIILHTTDGGVSWINQSSPHTGRLFGVYFIDSRKGWIASHLGEVYHTTDSGESWTQQFYESYDELGTIVFVDSLTGWIASDNGILKTTNGGELWVRKPAAMGCCIFDIHFINIKIGWASGFDGSLSHTTDGGESWIRTPFQTHRILTAVDFVDENLSWVVGDWGKILHTTNGGGVTFVEESVIDKQAPNEFILSQNYPNPFNPTTKIRFTIPTSPLDPSPYQGEGNRERFVTLIVYDVLGKVVDVLVNEEKPAGNYEVNFDGTGLSSGIYFYRLVIRASTRQAG
jgi:photosystem II stability/assembly factor-like uncharacterized protein